jgi:putative ABC transport system permease protein
MGWNTLLLAFREIRRNLLRSFLTILGIVIGVASVITLVTLGDGATKMVSDQISSLGSNLLSLRPGQRMGPGMGGSGAPAFKMADVEAIKSQVSGLNAVAPTANKSVTIVYGAENWLTSVTGTTNAWFVAGNWRINTGRQFTDSEERAGRAVCIIGETVRQQLFRNQNPVGSEIRIKQFSCEVIGLLASKGQGAMGMDQDDVVVMPLRAVQRRLTADQDVRAIMISVKDGDRIPQVMEQVKLLMRERRKLDDNEADNFSLFDTRQIAETLSGTIGTMTMLLGAVAAVSLLVGGIGIMNIMLVSVTERTREIGIRLAIGALEHEVLLQFLTEAVVLSAFGGLVGIVLAAIACYFLSDVLSVPFLFNPSINLLAFGFSATIGVIFGFVPARRAAQLDPIEALRHE